MQNGTHIPLMRPAAILLLAVILAAVAALSLHTGSATYAQTAAVSTPTAPHLTATSAGENAIELSWTGVPGAVRYELHRQEADNPGWQQIDGDNLRGTSFTDRGLTAGVTYQYALRAIDGNGEPLGPWSNFPKETVSGSGASTPIPTPTVTSAPAQTPTAAVSTPTAPQLTATSAGENAIELSWTEVPGAVRYELHRQEAANPGWQQIDGGNLRGTSFTDRGLTPGVTYQYAVRAIDASGQPLGPWSNFPKATVPTSDAAAATAGPTPTPTVTSAPAQTATAAVSTPTAPRLTATSAGANAIELSWTEVPGADRYELHRQEAAEPGWQQIDGGNLRDTSFTDRGLTPDVTYQYAVRAIDGNGEPLGPWSNFPMETVSGSGASTPIPTPTVTSAPAQTPTAAVSTPTAPRLTATSAGANAVELSWTEVPGAVRYALFTQEVAEPGWQQIDGGNLRDTSFRHHGLTPGVTYQYAVRAIDASGQPLGPWSNFPTVTVPSSDAAAATATATPTAGPTPTPTQSASTVTAPVLTARQSGANGVELRWTEIPGAVRYALFTQEVAEPGWQQIDGGNLRGTAFRHRELTPGITYQYAVRAIDASGQPLGPWSNFPTATVPASATTERDALIALYEAAGGDNWKHNDNWLSSAPIGAWHGVFTDENGHVTELRLEQNRLRGALPALNAFTHLKRLYLYENELTGPIPELKALTKLKSVGLSDNRFSGPVPALNALTNLRYLNLAGNQLTGPVPDLSAVPYLRELILRSNRLTGPIPDLSAHTRLWNLDLADNQLTGPIQTRRLPPDLWFLTLDTNQLTGPVPDLSAHANLKYLRLNSNQLTGPIPDLSALTNLTDLLLGGNRLTGPIPDLSALTKLRTLSLNSNQLTGLIPDVSTLTELDYLRLDSNQLTGPIPDLSALTKLTGLLLDYNRLTGPILNLGHLTRLTSLSLRFNQFTGPAPDLSALTRLTWLDLEGNQLCLPQGSGLSGANQVVSEHLNSLNLPACTGAELALTPGVPQDLTATVDDIRVTLRWSPVANAAAYELRVWDSINREWGGIGGDLRVTSHTHPVLKDGRNYYYQVRARNVSGVRSAWSAQVYAAVVTPRYPPPPSSLGLDMLYQKYLETNGVTVVAPSEVSDVKMGQTREVITGILSNRPDLLRTMAANNMIIFLESDDIRGVAFKIPGEWKTYVRAYDLQCENLIHEFAHVIHFAIEEQAGGPAFNARLLSLYQSALNAGLWEYKYASVNAVEYWAETVKYWLWGYSTYTGYATVADYDPEIVKLIEEELDGATVPAACKR